MKKYILFLIMFCVVYSVNAQNRERMQNARGKLEQLEKIKLMEVLNLDENTSLRFFARRNDYKKNIHEILDKREDLLKEIDQTFQDGGKNDKYYKQKIKELSELEYSIIKEKEKFYNSLTDILSYEQIAKLSVFEYKFRRELRDTFLKQKEDK